MKINRLFSIAAAALMMVACSSEDTALNNNRAAGPQMQFTATIAAPGSGATTRTAYTESGTDINVTWSVGDEIALIHDGVKDVATVKTVNANGSATINGFITKAENEAGVQLYYPAARISGVTGDGNPVFDGSVEGKISTQDGTLKYIQDNLDFRSAKGKLSVNGTEVTLKEPVKMAAENAIWKLTLSDGTNNLSATQVKIKGGESVLASTTTLTAGTSVVTLAMPTNLSVVGALTIEATVSEDTYSYVKEGVTLGAGKYYQSTVTMAKAIISTKDASETFTPTAHTVTKTYFKVSGYKILYGWQIGTGSHNTITISSPDGLNLSQVVLTVGTHPGTSTRNPSHLQVDHGTLTVTGTSQGSTITISGINSPSVTLSAPGSNDNASRWTFTQAVVDGKGDASK